MAPGTDAGLASLVRAAAARAGSAPALLGASGAALSWTELDRRVDAVAARLREAAAPGDRALLALGNTVEFVAAYFGVLRAGLVAVPVNPEGAAPELRHQIADCGPVVAFAAGAAEEEARRAGVPLVLTAADVAGLPEADPPPAGVAAESTAVLLYTSGTTGTPRAVALTHRALLANLDQLARVSPAPVAPDDVVLLVLPLFHVYGLNAALGMVARQAASAVLVARFDPVDTLRVIREHRVTNLIGAPPMYVAWSMLGDLRESFASVRLAVSGAAPLPAELLVRLRELAGLDVFEGYGLTEAAPVVTSTLVSGRPKPGSVGRALPGVQLELRDRKGLVPPDGDPGEICIRGANLFSGYWPDGDGGPDDDGWFATGDVGYVDDEGDLYLVDRLRDLVLVSGFNVFPREVEEVLRAHPDVADVAVVGVPHPYTGETVKALVVPRRGAEPDPDELIGFASASLARFKCPTSVEFVDSLPRVGGGKLAKGRLRRR